MSDLFDWARRLRAYYAINRETWPTMTRRAALLDALRLARKVSP